MVALLTATRRELSTALLLDALKSPMIRVAEVFACHPGRVFSKAELIERVYGDAEPDSADSAIGVTVRRLRDKGWPIVTHGWAGYSYEPKL